MSGAVNPFACYIRDTIALQPGDTINILSDINDNEITAVHFWPGRTAPTAVWPFQRIPLSIFRKFPNLKSFTLPARIASIASSDFSDACNLEFLQLSNNNVRVVPTHAFALATKLVKIDLSWNKINCIASHAFDKLMRLKYLHMDRNRLAGIGPNMFAGIGTLSVLTMSFNQIERIDDDAFAHVPHLIELDLSHNKLRTLSRQTFRHCGKLQKLQLQSNGLRTIGEAFNRLLHLHHVNLDRNHIEDVRLDAFAALPHLDSLSLQYNGHRAFDAVVAEAATVKSNANGSSELRELLLAGNELRNPFVLRALYRIGFVNLEKLDLDSNAFDEIDFVDIEMFPRLKQINLGKNMWKCDWLNETVRRMEDENVGIHLYSSHFPLPESAKHVNFIQCT